MINCRVKKKVRTQVFTYQDIKRDHLVLKRFKNWLNITSDKQQGNILHNVTEYLTKK